MPKPVLPSLAEAKILSASDVMTLLGYKNRQAFFEAARRTGMPMIRLSKRRFVFEQTSLDRWIASRVVGSVPSDPSLN